MRKRITFRLFFIPVLMMFVGFGLSSSGWAIDLQTAKSQGAVGEKPNGYLGLVNASASGDVKSMMKKINALRKKEYQKIAQRNKTNLSSIETLAGKKVMGKTPAGQYVQTSGGKWVKK